MKVNNPILFFLVCFFTIINVLDIITANIIKAGETNIIYLFTGSMIWLLLFKIILVYGAWNIYKHNVYPSHFFYYLFLIIMVLGNLLMLLGVLSNIIGIINPQHVEVASKLTTTQKTTAYVSFISFIYLIPLAFSVLTFKLYEWSVKCITFKSDMLEQGKFKSKIWWKFKF